MFPFVQQYFIIFRQGFREKLIREYLFLFIIWKNIYRKLIIHKLHDICHKFPSSFEDLLSDFLLEDQPGVIYDQYKPDQPALLKLDLKHAILFNHSYIRVIY